MNKTMFMNTLIGQLKGLPEADKKEIIFDYEEHFRIGMEEGRTEEDIAESLGNPKMIARELKANLMITKAEESFTFTNFVQALLATIGLGFFNLIFVLGPFLGIAITLITLFLSGLAFVLSGVAVIFASFFPDASYLTVHPVVAIFTGAGIFTFGILWMIGFAYLNKYFFIATVKYLKFNYNIITNRRMKHEN